MTSAEATEEGGQNALFGAFIRHWGALKRKSSKFVFCALAIVLLSLSNGNGYVFLALVVAGGALGIHPVYCALPLAATRVFLELHFTCFMMRGVWDGWWFDTTLFLPGLCSFGVDAVLFGLLGLVVYTARAVLIRTPLAGQGAWYRPILRKREILFLLSFCLAVVIALGAVTHGQTSRSMREEYTRAKALGFDRLCEVAADRKANSKDRAVAILLLPEMSRGDSRTKAKGLVEEVRSTGETDTQVSLAASMASGAMKGEGEVANMTGDASYPLIFRLFDYCWLCQDKDESDFYMNLRCLGK